PSLPSPPPPRSLPSSPTRRSSDLLELFLAGHVDERADQLLSRLVRRVRLAGEEKHHRPFLVADDAPEIVEIVEEQRRSLVRRERSEEHTSEVQSRSDLVCRLLLEK